jgi:hypothetical protein
MGWFAIEWYLWLLINFIAIYYILKFYEGQKIKK